MITHLDNDIIQSLPYTKSSRKSLRFNSSVTNTLQVRTGHHISVIVSKDAGILGKGATEVDPDKANLLIIVFAGPNDGKIRAETNAILGLYSNILTFLRGNPINGNRACKFTLLE